jgi:DnaK suppressor protein
MEIDTQYFKDLLEKESEILEKELLTLGRRNPDNLSDWEATEKPNGTDEADELEVADSLEEFENNRGTLNQLEIRLNEVKKALANIESGDYGVCEKCDQEIENDRLEANPAAGTCKAHM